jgi:hypothetical protein
MNDNWNTHNSSYPSMKKRVCQWMDAQHLNIQYAHYENRRKLYQFNTTTRAKTYERQVLNRRRMCQVPSAHSWVSIYLSVLKILEEQCTLCCKLASIRRNNVWIDCNAFI